MEKAAKREKKTAKEISNHYLKLFKDDFKKLNILNPHHWPKATQYIKEQTELINELEKKSYTYTTSDGIYFNTSKFKDYGQLAGLQKQKRQAGKRVPMGEKLHKTDFALWKFSPENERRQQEWRFKNRKGFPGWHLECSAMSMKYLGKNFDIHTGGEDHIHIHHSNEIAQSEAATGKKFVNYWLHGAFLTFKGEKVSKSKGGLYTVAELEEKNFKPLAYRYLCLTAHYKRPLEFSLNSLEAAQNSYTRLKERVEDLKDSKDRIQHPSLVKQYKNDFLSKINNNLDIPKAIALIWTLLKDITLNKKEKYNLIIDFDKVLGLNLKETKKGKLSTEIKKLIQSRESARKKKDFKTADQIRDQLEKKGIILEDTQEGVKWKTK
jgi:cysteinyl-tRNA synthetase